MFSLIIIAHPSTKGFTRRIAASYKQGREERGGRAKLIDLYSDEYKQDFFHFEDIENLPADAKRDHIQDLIRQADELVFIHPLWWWSMPAIMKNFIDTNFQSGFAYRYKSIPILKGRPVGLLKGKTARIFMTTDSPKWFAPVFIAPIRRIWSLGILHLFGIKLRSFTVFDRMRWRSDDEKERWLDMVNGMANRGK